MKELIAVTEDVTGSPISTEVIPRRGIDLATPTSNPEKAMRELGWKGARTVRESIENTYKFLSQKRKKEHNTKQSRVVHFVPYFPPHA